MVSWRGSGNTFSFNSPVGSRPGARPVSSVSSDCRGCNALAPRWLWGGPRPIGLSMKGCGAAGNGLRGGGWTGVAPEMEPWLLVETPCGWNDWGVVAFLPRILARLGVVIRLFWLARRLRSPWVGATPASPTDQLILVGKALLAWLWVCALWRLVCPTGRASAEWGYWPEIDLS